MTGPIKVPEGFVEFSLQMMQRAKELRDAPKGIITIDENSPIDIAAIALLRAVEPPTLEGQANEEKPFQ